MRRLLGFSLLTGALCVAGCGKKQATETSTARPATSADHLADGKALTNALSDWKTRWEREAVPPSCDELVKAVEDRKLCTDTAAALAALKERVQTDAAGPEVLRAASALSLAGSHAEKRLRFLAMEYLGTQGASASAPGSASGASPATSGAPSPASRAFARIAASATPGNAASAQSLLRSLSALRDAGAANPGAVGRDNPYQGLVRGYSKLSVQALRFIGVYVEKAPLPLRTAAVGELERLNADHEPWHQLAQVARQGALLEQTPALKTRLAKLDPLGGAARRALPRKPSSQ